MKIGRLVLLGVLILGASASAEAATSAPKLHAAKVATPVTLAVKDKKKVHAHKSHKSKHKVAQSHKVKPAHHAKKVKKSKHG